MNTQLIKIIREFLSKDKDMKLRNRLKKPTSQIRDSEDGKWALLTSMASFRSEKELNEIQNILNVIKEFDGAIDLAEQWVSHVKKNIAIETVLFGKIKESGGVHEKFIEIRSGDAYLVKKHSESLKSELLRLISENGGVTEFSKKIKMSQSSLSRFFNSESNPRLSTILKIFDGLGVKSVEIKL